MDSSDKAQRAQQTEGICELDKTLGLEAIEHLRQRFSSIQVFATRYDIATGETVRLTMGAGDFYARFGLVELWLEDQSLSDEEE